MAASRRAAIELSGVNVESVLPEISTPAPSSCIPAVRWFGQHRRTPIEGRNMENRHECG